MFCFSRLSPAWLLLAATAAAAVSLIPFSRFIHQFPLHCRLFLYFFSSSVVELFIVNSINWRVHSVISTRALKMWIRFSCLFRCIYYYYYCFVERKKRERIATETHKTRQKRKSFPTFYFSFTTFVFFVIIRPRFDYYLFILRWLHWVCDVWIWLWALTHITILYTHSHERPCACATIYFGMWWNAKSLRKRKITPRSQPAPTKKFRGREKNTHCSTTK